MKILINTSGMSKDDIDFSGFEKLGSIFVCFTEKAQ